MVTALQTCMQDFTALEKRLSRHAELEAAEHVQTQLMLSVFTKPVTSVGSSFQRITQDQSCTDRTLCIVVNDVLSCSAAEQNILLC